MMDYYIPVSTEFQKILDLESINVTIYRKGDILSCNIIKIKPMHSVLKSIDTMELWYRIFYHQFFKIMNICMN